MTNFNWSDKISKTFTKCFYFLSSKWLNKLLRLFLSINDFTNAANNHFVAAFNSSILSQNIIARFSYPALINESNIYNYSCLINKDLEEDNRVRTYFGPVNINRLHIQILDEYGRVVDFNNMDWSLTLALDMLYD